jgi:hypothetical protein
LLSRADQERKHPKSAALKVQRHQERRHSRAQVCQEASI